MTFTVEARRAQLIGLTIGLIAEHGYAGCSLQRIADAAGVTKAAVLYHFSSKDALVRAAYDQVIGALTGHVGALVDAAADAGGGGAGQVAAYIRGMAGHLARHPDHVRMIVEALGDGGVPDRSSPARWQALAGLIETAGWPVDAKTLALIIGGALDGLVTEFLNDPDFDLPAGAEALIRLLPLSGDRAAHPQAADVVVDPGHRRPHGGDRLETPGPVETDAVAVAEEDGDPHLRAAGRPDLVGHPVQQQRAEAPAALGRLEVDQ
nr:TetR/AcrR family transcriptional regulator [Actinoplanes sp. DH11]